MRHLERVMVAVTAIIAIAFSSAVGATLVGLWRHSPEWHVERASNGLKWQAGTLSAELTLSDGAFEQLVVWRSLPEDAQILP